MSNNRLLNTCLSASIICHFVILTYVVNSPTTPPRSILLTPIEMFTIKKIVPSFPAGILNHHDSPRLQVRTQAPAVAIERKTRSLSLTNQIINKQVRGGELSLDKELNLPLQSSFKQANEMVELAAVASLRSKAVPTFAEQGLDYFDRGLFVKEESLKELTSADDITSTASEGKKSYLEQYRTELMERIKRVVSYPDWAQKKGIRGQVTLQVLIKRDGEISNVEVYKSSGNTRLDRETVDNVVAINSLPAFPVGLGASQAKILIPVDYSLN